MNDDDITSSKGILSAASAHVLWGVPSFYLHLLGVVTAPKLLAYWGVMPLTFLIEAARPYRWHASSRVGVTYPVKAATTNRMTESAR